MEQMKKAEAMKLLERIGRAIKELPEDVRIGRLFMVNDGKGAVLESGIHEVAEVVRCQRCAKRNTPDCAMWYQCEVCGGQWSWETDEDFCSRGELKQ